MQKKMQIAVVLLIVVSLAQCAWEINDSVNIRDGEKRSSGKTAINGNVFVGSDCEVRGTLRSVNGTIRIGTNSKVGSLQAVNGSIGLEENVHVHGGVKVINGQVMTESGVIVEGHVTAADGDVELINTTVFKDVVTHNGDITLESGCEIKGNVIVRKSRSKGEIKERVRILLVDAVVMGNIDIQDDEVKAEVIMRGNSKVKGQIKNAEVKEQ